MTKKALMKCDDLIGAAVVSLTGRDHKRTMIVVGTESEADGLTGRVLIADGRLRKIEKPKLKKLMHVKPIQGFAAEARQNDFRIAREKFRSIRLNDQRQFLFLLRKRGDQMLHVNGYAGFPAVERNA